VGRSASAVKVDRNGRIGALFTVGDILKQVFGFSFEARGAKAEGVVLGSR
jgi:hypothetical protein